MGAWPTFQLALHQWRGASSRHAHQLRIYLPPSSEGGDTRGREMEAGVEVETETSSDIIIYMKVAKTVPSPMICRIQTISGSQDHLDNVDRPRINS